MIVIEQRSESILVLIFALLSQVLEARYVEKKEGILFSFPVHKIKKKSAVFLPVGMMLSSFDFLEGPPPSSQINHTQQLILSNEHLPLA